MKSRKWNLTLGFLALGVLGACGGDDSNNSGGNGNATVYTGLPSNRTLSSLTESEVQTACKGVSDAAASFATPEASLRSECFGKGLSGAISASSDGSLTVDVAKCQMLTDSCVADPASAGVAVDKEGDTGIDCMGADPAEFAGCEATIGEFEGCLNKILAAYQQVLASLTCSNGQSLVMNGGPQPADTSMIPECMSLSTKCPKVELPGQ